MPRPASAPKTCTGPACDRPQVARGLCASHLRQLQRDRPLTPLRTGPALARIQLRVSPECGERIRAQPAAARLVLEHWSRGR